jgi:RNA polymerase sigma-70 factor, ECF subfamily
MSPKAPHSEDDLIERLRQGDEAAFGELIDRYYASMVRLARMFVDSESSAEEVVQESWLAVIDGVDRFEGRSTIKTWMFSILTNQAKTRARKDDRTRAWSSIFEVDMADGVSAEADRFDPSGSWLRLPTQWQLDPEEQLVRQKLLGVVQQAIEELPTSQQSVVWLRDVEGLSSQEVCDVLDISSGNQRVLLHRGRVKLRRAVEAYDERDQEDSP